MMTIRRMKKSDVIDVSNVICDALRYTNAQDYSEAVINRLCDIFSPENISEKMEGRTVFVALDDDEIIGTVSLEQNTVKTLFVSPNHQGKGVGSQLMNAVEASATKAGRVSLTLSSSLTAQSFYKKLGYEVQKSEFFGEEETILMQRKLLT